MSQGDENRGSVGTGLPMGMSEVWSDFQAGKQHSGEHAGFVEAPIV